jgi:hypothetical protein
MCVCIYMKMERQDWNIDLAWQNKIADSTTTMLSESYITWGLNNVFSGCCIYNNNFVNLLKHLQDVVYLMINISCWLTCKNSI